MTAEPTAATPSPDAVRAALADVGRELLERAPWDQVATRATLLLANPPQGDWAQQGPAELWLLLDHSEARALPAQWRQPLLEHGVHHLPIPGRAGAALLIFETSTVERLLDAVGGRSMELRWSVRHAEALHDPLRRLEPLGAAAGRLPEGAPERIARGLYLRTVSAMDAAAVLIPGEIAAAGEAAAAVSRLACFLEDGAYPPPPWLIAAALQTSLGARLAVWLQRIPAAVAGDEEALPWVRDTSVAALAQVAAVLRPLFGTTDWFQHPREHALRAPR